MISLYSQIALNKHCLNNSKTKQMYSFSKSPRFKPLKKSSSASSLYINFPNTFSNRKAFIGYGKKSDFTKGYQAYGQLYKIPRLFDNNNKSIEFPNSPKFSFGISRDKMDKVVVGKSSSSINISNPAPNQYNPTKFYEFGSGSPKYTMLSRHNSYYKQVKNFSTPGPSDYQSIYSLNKNGKYFLSSLSNTYSSNWSLSKTKRFVIKNDKTPGPQYNLENLTGNLKIFNSQYKTPKYATIIGKYKSIFLPKNNNPGPGAYLSFSELGMYKSKKADDMEKKAYKTFMNKNYHKLFKSSSFNSKSSKNSGKNTITNFYKYKKENSAKNENDDNKNSNNEKEEKIFLNNENLNEKKINKNEKNNDKKSNENSKISNNEKTENNKNIENKENSENYYSEIEKDEKLENL